MGGHGVCDGLGGPLGLRSHKTPRGFRSSQLIDARVDRDLEHWRLIEIARVNDAVFGHVVDEASHIVRRDEIGGGFRRRHDQRIELGVTVGLVRIGERSRNRGQGANIARRGLVAHGVTIRRLTTRQLADCGTLDKQLPLCRERSRHDARRTRHVDGHEPFGLISVEGRRLDLLDRCPSHALRRSLHALRALHLAGLLDVNAALTSRRCPLRATLAPDLPHACAVGLLAANALVAQGTATLGRVLEQAIHE